MPTSQSELLQGTLELLILKALALQELHGMGISRRVHQITDGTFDVKAGSLFPALHRMEEAGWLTSAWGESETNRRANLFPDEGRKRTAAVRDGAMGAHISGDGDGASKHIEEVPMINKLRALWKNLLRKDQVEDDLDEELSEYLASLAEDKMRSGMNHDEAYVAARHEMGGVDQVRQSVRNIRTGVSLR